MFFFKLESMHERGAQERLEQVSELLDDLSPSCGIFWQVSSPLFNSNSMSDVFPWETD